MLLIALAALLFKTAMREIVRFSGSRSVKTVHRSVYDPEQPGHCSQAKLLNSLNILSQCSQRQKQNPIYLHFTEERQKDL